MKKQFKHLKPSKAIPKLIITFIFIMLLLAGVIAVSAFTAIDNEISKLDDATITRFVKSQPVGEFIDVSGSALVAEPAEEAKAIKESTEVAETTEKPTEAAPEESIDTVESEATEEVTEETTFNYSGEIDLLAKVIYLESGSCSEYCQWLVGSTAMNLADENGGLANVAYDYGTFEVAPKIDSCTPSELSISVAKRVLSGDRDSTVKAFRDDYYHEWATPYLQVDNVYFSTY